MVPDNIWHFITTKVPISDVRCAESKIDGDQQNLNDE